MNDKYLVSQSAIAEVLNVSREAVRKWRSCPRNKNGDYHLPSVVSWYVNTKAKSYKLEVKQLRERLKQKDEELNIDVFAVTVRFRKSFQLFGNKELYALTSQLHKPILIFNN